MQISKTYIIFILIIAKLLATAFSLYVVDQITPLVDARLYQSEDFFNHTLTLRTYLVQITVSVFNFLTSPIISHYIFSFISILGILWYVIFYKVTWHILFILLLPTSMIWTSIIGKEAIYYCLFSVLLVNWNILINKQLKISNCLLVLIISILCLILRPHYFIGIIWLYWSAVIIHKYKNYKSILFFTYLSLCIFISIILFYGHTLSDFFNDNVFDLRWRAFTSIDIDGNASRHEYLGLIVNENICLNKINCEFLEERKKYLEIEFSKYFGVGMIFGIIGPFLSETIQRPEFIPFFVEGLIILLMPVVFFTLCKSNKNFYYSNIYFKNYVYGIMPAILLLMIIHAYFGILNPGTAIRWRINFELIFYFAPYLIYLNLKEFKNEKNPTFSS